MKKKTLSAIIAVSMAAAAFSGCGNGNKPAADLTAQEVAKGAAEAIESASSVSSQLTIDLSGSFTYQDQTADMSMLLGCGIETVMDPVSAHITETLKMSYMDQSSDQAIEFYLVPEDGKQYVYTGSGDTWTKSEATGAESEESSDTIFREIADGNIDAKLADTTETLNDRSAYVLDLSVTGDYLSDMIDFSFNGDTGLFGNVDYSDMEMDTEIYVYADTLEPALLKISCDEMGAAMFEQMFGYTDVDCDIDNYSISCEYTGFNEISEITVPDSVKAAAGNTADASGETPQTDPSGTDGPASDGDSIGEDTASVEAAIENAPEIIYSSSTGELDLEFSMSIDGAEYVIPASYSELTDNGWTVSEDSDGLVYAGDYDLEYMYKDDAAILAYIYNPGSSDAEYAGCEIIGIDVMSFDSENKQVSLPSGVVLSESTLDDVLAAYGKPTSFFVDESMIYLGYMSADQANIASLYFNYDTHVLDEIDIQSHPASDQGLTA